MTEIVLPVIDISQFPKDFEGLHCQSHPEIAKLREACKEWGFFSVVNHGIPVDLLQKVVRVSRDLMSMPTEVKEGVQNYNPIRPNNHSETFSFFDMPNPDSIQEFSRKMWPEEGNSNFCEAIGAYNKFLSDLGPKITKFIIASLGLDSRAYYQSDFKRCTSALFIAGYVSDGKCLGDVVLHAHADPGCVAILYTDENEGLQVRSKEGKWINVKPAPDSLIINIGDSMKAWSNGRYHSTHHRVIYKGWRSRIALSLFITFPLDARVCAPEELVDQDNPRRYNPFTVSELLKEIKSKNVDGDFTNVVEGMAGIVSMA